MSITELDLDQFSRDFAAEIAKPFASTIWDNPESRRSVLRSVGLAFAPDIGYGQRRSFTEKQAAKDQAILRADERLYNATRQALLRQRRELAELAARYSPEAADAIRELADIPEWSEG